MNLQFYFKMFQNNKVRKTSLYILKIDNVQKCYFSIFNSKLHLLVELQQICMSKWMTKLSQGPLTSSVPGTGGSIDLALEEIMTEFSMVFQLELYRQILKEKVKLLLLFIRNISRLEVFRITYISHMLFVSFKLNFNQI